VTVPLFAALADRYTIERELGQGGMATVYLAQDLKHDRKVALKVLRPELAAVLGAERFVVEIKTTAALQHPHILPLFDSGTADGFLYYVMPYIEGETLRDKLSRETQLGIEEAVRITTDVADALDYAHRHGVIHRDIKPENILLHDGRPMVADFGIALALSAAAGGRMTETGLSLGTPHYMSPEQATAEKEITGRSDIYSLGSVLYEMLTGSPPHVGSSAQQIIMKIVTEEAAPVTKLRKSVPANVAAAVSKTLEKLPADRFASAKEFADALTNPAFTVTPVAGSATLGVPASWKARAAVPLAAAAGILLVAAAWGWLRRADEPALHVSVPPPAGTSFLLSPMAPALSPDGRTVVFAAVSGGATRLYRRPVDGFRVEAIEGSDDATYPFFSPDGAWVGYYTRSRQLRKIPLAGGPPITIADIPFYRSTAVWRRNGTIVVESDTRGLYAVPDHGGALAPLTEVDSAAGEHTHTTPQELSDGRLLLTVWMRERSASGGAHLAILEPGESPPRRVPGNPLPMDVISLDARVTYVEPGYLIARPGNETVAMRYDLRRGRASGTPVPVLDGASFAPPVTPRGDIAYYAFPKLPTQRFLVLVDRSGSATRLPVTSESFRHPRLSPDGARLVVDRIDDVWVLDLRTYAWTRLTTTRGVTEAQWSPDGRRVVHSRFIAATGYNGLVWRNADGSGEEHLVHAGTGDDWPSDWSRDGRHVVVYGGAIGNNVSVVDLDSAHSFHPVTRSAATTRNARFSPDGRWLAYQSDETGRTQVYLVSYPDLARKVPVSTEGGTEAAWRPDGGELFYRTGTRMMVVAIQTVPTLQVGTPRELFRGPFEEDQYGDRSYDVMPDGQHFVMFESDPASAPELRVIRNWTAELRAALGRP
jgi:Tol biopolymer transport system component/tRNA A-37 threonylcarbamoyl transferase component Bud32